MKHVNLSDCWKFTTEPFPAFRVRMVYGRNKRCFAFVPVKGIFPTEEGTLPEGRFRVIKTRAKGTILIVPGRENSNRVLLFTSAHGGFRGGVKLVEKYSTGRLLTVCDARNATQSGLALAAILADGEQIVVRSWGRRNDDYIVWENVSGELVETRYTASEWQAIQDLDLDSGDFEEL